MQTKTLADLKRGIIVGGTVELIEYLDATTNDTIPEKLQGPRTVTTKNTVGFYLNRTPKDGKRGSFCNWPKASALSYNNNDDTFIITERYLTDMMGGRTASCYRKNANI